MTFKVLPLLLQSEGIDFADWVSLITLGLAPLIAHLAAGAPQPSYLTSTHPRWHDRICHYIPTSIVWRYAAITDRRIRSSGWDIPSIAAANALFWTPRGWNGSEEMAACSMDYCTYLPETARVEVLSWDFAKTLIVTVQGIQAIYNLGGNTAGWGPVVASVDAVFSPLAILGLYRLSAALWLTNHFAFAPREQVLALGGTRRLSLDSLLQHTEKPASEVHAYRPTAYLPSRMFRSVFFLLMLTAWVMLLLHTFGSIFIQNSPQSVSYLVCIIFYHLILFPSLLVIGYYFVRGMATSTIIPCISSTWYKIYSVALMGLMVALVVVSSLETRKTPCGLWTVTGGFDGDYWACTLKDPEYIIVDPKPRGGAFGIASTFSDTKAELMLESGQYWVDNFTGFCVGTWSSDKRALSKTLEHIGTDGLMWPSPDN
ncbi:hypothetical protein Daus18300_008146 [Diaporthe australafricana]|uniref:Uncharacterized protein n=1 Tax=Diaporthe australafricana TaxID=127596 RepID=A0ABR3WJ20_9PEZI